MTSAPVTAWPERLALTALVLGFIVLALYGMRAGWRGRARRQASIPAPASTLTARDGSAPRGVLLQVPGRFIGTSIHGDWLDRVVVHDLGVPSPAVLLIHPEGLLLRRTGARDVAIPVADLDNAGFDSAVGGDVVDGALIVTWRLGGHVLDTGFRPQATESYRALADAIDNVRSHSE
jgi:hypothetical protein